MINVNQFRKYVVRQPLKSVGLWSPEAEALLMGTAAQESHLGTYLKQVGTGPAMGVFQMEPATYRDIKRNYLRYKPVLRLRVKADKPERMITDLAHAAVMCRLHYLRVPAALPAFNDIDGLAKYWKDHYNTHLGKGTIEEFKRNYDRFITI